MKAVLFAAGQVQDYESVREETWDCSLVICADGGIRHADVLGLTPLLVLGDFDSADPALLHQMAERGIPTRQFSREKDWTDTQLAVEEVLRHDVDELVLVGVSGTRLDHTLANLFLLTTIPEQVRVSIVDGKNTIRLLRPGFQLRVRRRVGDFLSLVPLTPEVAGIMASGVKWPLTNAVLHWGDSLGISNEITDAEAVVSIQQGMLLVMQSRD